MDGHAASGDCRRSVSTMLLPGWAFVDAEVRDRPVGCVFNGIGLRDADELRAHGSERDRRAHAFAFTLGDGLAPGLAVGGRLDGVATWIGVHGLLTETTTAAPRRSCCWRLASAS